MLKRRSVLKGGNIEQASMRIQMAAENTIAPVLLKEVDVYQDKRYLTAIGEFDRVMGEHVPDP